MNAMQMMLNQLGLDPEALRQNAENIGKLVADIDARLGKLEGQNALIISMLEKLTADKEAPPSVEPASTTEG